MTFGRMALVLAVAASTAAAVWAFVCSVRALSAISELSGLRGPEGSGSAGLGAVSIGISEAIVETVLVCAIPITLNLSLARAAREWGRLATRLRRAHLLLTLAIFGMSLVHPIVLLTVISATPAGVIEVFWISGTLYALGLGAQVLFGGATLIQLLRTGTALKARDAE